MNRHTLRIALALMAFVVSTALLHAAEMTIAYPVPYAIVQRSSPSGGPIPIRGRYAGIENPGKIEARFKGGPWQVVDGKAEKGVFSGTIEGTVGQGKLEVRAAGAPGLSATVECVAVGDLLVIAGQSNADGRGNKQFTLSPANRYVGVKYRRGQWSNGDDPAANDGDFGSPWPPVLDALIAAEDVPVGIITAAVGSTVVKQWRKGGDLYARMIEMVRAATGGTMRIKAVLYYQGENDLTHYNTRSVLGDYAEYKKNLLAAATDIQNDLHAPFLVGQITNLGGQRDGNDNVRRAQQEAWSEHPAVRQGAIAYDILPTDGCHYREEANMRAFSRRWASAVLASVYGKEEFAGPRLQAVVMVNPREFKVSFDRPIAIARWDGTAATKALGFRIKDADQVLTDANVTATRVDQREVTLSLDRPVSPAATLWYGSGSDGQGQPTLRDARNGLPIRMMFGERAVKVAQGTAAGNRIVARNDQDVDPRFLPPKILGRRFWNLLPAQQAKAMEKHVLKEPMLRDAARSYSLSDLRASGGDRLAVNGEELLKLQPDPRVPFVLHTSAGRPPFRCMDDFRVDKTRYAKWKQEHPNFLGFWSGVEWDNEFVTPLDDPDHAADWARKHGCSEAAIRRMQEILAQARADRSGAVEGLHQCHAALRRFFFDDPEKMLFLRAGWCFDHYALEWGAGMVVAETTNTGPYRHQVSLFNVRGAARQYGKPWAWYMATYYNGCDETGARSVNNEPNYLSRTRSSAPGSEENSGPGYGMSVSLKRRDMYLAYLSGASLVEHEDWPRAYCQPEAVNPSDWVLSPHGEAMKEWYAFTERHPDRGASYAPVALLVPFNQGAPQWGGNPWSHFPAERADTMIDAFLYTIAPFSQDVRKGQEGCLGNGPFGDLYDVLAPDPPSGPIALDRLRDYQVALALGKLDLGAPLAARLMEYVREGGTLVVNSQQAGGGLPREFLGVQRTGKTAAIEGPVSSSFGGAPVALAEPYDYEPVQLCGAKAMWTDAKGGVLAVVSSVGRGRVVLTTVDWMVPRRGASLVGTAAKMPLVELLMRQIVEEVLPVAVRGDIQYGLNKVSDGWWVYLINNKGVTKYTTTPERLDAAQTAEVTVDLRALRAVSLRELRKDEPVVLDRDKNAFTIRVGPGDIRIVKIATGPRE